MIQYVSYLMALLLSMLAALRYRRGMIPQSLVLHCPSPVRHIVSVDDNGMSGDSMSGDMANNIEICTTMDRLVAGSHTFFS